MCIRDRFLIVYPSVVENKDAMPIAMGFLVLTQSLGPVSYTHLDVYKRQGKNCE